VIQDVNQAPLDRGGYRREDLIGKPFYDAPWWTWDAGVRAQLMRAIESAKLGYSQRYDVLVRMGSDLVPIDFQISPLRDASGRIVGLLPTAVDITERKRAEGQLRIAAVAFEAQVGIIVTDANAVILKVNRAITEATGYCAEEIVGQTPRLFKSGRHDREFYAAMWESLRAKGSWEGEIWDRRKSGEIYPKRMVITALKNETGAVANYVSTQMDITERKAAEEEVRYLAFYDPLTHLPNRRLLLDRLRQALAASARRERHGALLFVDLDHFKNLNDTMGHILGDALLEQVAERLRRAVRKGDTVARLGGDEFVVMAEDLSGDVEEAAAQARAIGDSVLCAIRAAYKVGSQDYLSTASIGVTVFMGSADSSIEEILKQADLAMYQAKAAGRNAICFFDPEMQSAVLARVALESELRGALAGGQFMLYYQPQMLGESALTGAEALLRWRHPVRGLVPPGAFIPVAEESELIVALGRWVLESVCRQLIAWEATPGLSQLTLSVNVSAREFRQANFVEQVLEVLGRTGADPGRLKLELTESMLLEDVNDAIAKMARLKSHGVRFAVDDFGIGYSSLSYLKRLPLELVKIDRSFIKDALTDENDAAIARTIIALAQILGLSVIAEGVETVAQRMFLERHGCTRFQGHLFATALPIEQFEHFAARLSCEAASRRKEREHQVLEIRRSA
jgi:diguanylate cyclase (GGDEF)-like protein/PAS domain S-box-containing protein